MITAELLPYHRGYSYNTGVRATLNIAKLTQIQNHIIRTTTHIEYPILKCGVIENEENDEKRREPSKLERREKPWNEKLDGLLRRH